MPDPILPGAWGATTVTEEPPVAYGVCSGCKTVCRMPNPTIMQGVCSSHTGTGPTQVLSLTALYQIAGKVKPNDVALELIKIVTDYAWKEMTTDASV
jgi:hypothetical protein